MEKSVLVFIAAPVMGHLAQSVQLAKLMLEKNNQLSVLVLVMKVPIDPEGTIKVQNIISGCSVERLHFHHLPTPENTNNWSSNRGLFMNQLVEFQKPHVREIASKIEGLSGFILDFGTATSIDVAEEFQVPSYIFCTSGAAYFGLMLHVQSLQDDHNQDTIELFKTSEELIVPSFVQPVPISVLPTATTDKLQWSVRMRRYQYYRKPKGVIMNTFSELEDHALNSFLKDSAYGKSGLPQIYPVGPILNRSEMNLKSHSQTIEWLDKQPQNSVVLVSFGSLGSFDLDQVKEIASGLEQSGHRFLWVLRRPPTEKGGFPDEYENVELVLPKGFLDRTASIGKVVGWVPQLAVLSHPAVGGFVSHCGWNSILESIWCGVPIATWPLAAEQQLNAFQLVKELGIAVEISLDYNEAKEHQELLRAEEIGKGVMDLMDGNNEMRKRVKEFSEKSRAAVQENGSSHLCFENLVQTICSGSHKWRGEGAVSNAKI
ncbi:anthocyanidin 3-O-glucosyltransferase 2-like [Coffea eugenioides]|uniref:anthocyanidin 3-O-glucosyltransferase 2-like n=1 Tax=Coffea eugenioides TaxID=49369 RepID=UPI000F607E81|nr:anthocyanidin 3-O-glucosyltransferase 2-like [Coffea eugenioides]